MAATRGGCVQAHRDNEAVSGVLDDRLDAAFGDGEGDLHATYGGEGRTGHHQPESIRRRSRKVSKSPPRHGFLRL